MLKIRNLLVKLFKVLLMIRMSCEILVFLVASLEKKIVL